ncbi:hypothetical protein [Nitrosomonas communis]|uniref:Uncharacterized protein n=1 Tax=Nitrosomonas communis TaxID=44574 RepID=A0A1H2X3A5_9PROT|nr:hypothetical protein [Nitrosomonas communis]SDW87360.1 hypothetical protein SAMN05421882_103414 [Nitrosomonas communis]
MTSSQALADPFSKYITLDRDLVNIPILQGIIGDAHLITRHPMGRDIAFLCRIYGNGRSDLPRSISIDEETALLIDALGIGTVVGKSNAYFLQAPGAPEICQAGSPLTYKYINVYRINAAGGKYQLLNWHGIGGSEYLVSAVEGVLISDQDSLSSY